MSRSFTREETRRLASILADTAQAEVMPRFQPARGAVRGKTSVRDLVTDADEAAERMISARLAKLYPGAVLIGEEASTRNPALLNMLVDADLAFLIDPIDGTRNYVAGLPLFGMMIAACHRGDVIAGVIYDPVSRDSAGRARRRRMDGIRERQAGAAGRGQSRAARGHGRPDLHRRAARAAAQHGQRQSFEVGSTASLRCAAMNTACWRRAIAMSRCTTSSPPGTTPRAGCCTAKPAAMPRASTVRRTSHAPQRRPAARARRGQLACRAESADGRGFRGLGKLSGRGPSPSGVPFSGTPPRVIPRSYPHYLWTTLWKAL